MAVNSSFIVSSLCSVYNFVHLGSRAWLTLDQFARALSLASASLSRSTFTYISLIVTVGVLSLRSVFNSPHFFQLSHSLVENPFRTGRAVSNFFGFFLLTHWSRALWLYLFTLAIFVFPSSPWTLGSSRRFEVVEVVYLSSLHLEDISYRLLVVYFRSKC